MRGNEDKILMAEAAVLYYEEGRTQQQIAQMMGLSRQTVSKLLGDAVKENIVEIKIHNPQKDLAQLEAQLQERFGIQRCIVCGVSSKNEAVRQLMTVKAAVDYLLPLIRQGGLKIGVSWGRTVQALIEQFPDCDPTDNTVFPLFGATDNEHAYFSSNELARSLADRLGASVRYAWFPYLADSKEDFSLLKRLSYYKKMEQLWHTADVAILGIGNREVLDIFSETFGVGECHRQVTGDLATHFFDETGTFIPLYHNALCASIEDLRRCKQAVAIACGNHKANAIACALRTGLLNTLITDEYTAKAVLEYA